MKRTFVLLLLTACLLAMAGSNSQRARIYQIQGRGHTSPLLDKTVVEVAGVVTAVSLAQRNKGFWMQDPVDDGNVATSEGIFVATGQDSPGVAVGNAVSVSGRVAERSFRGQLSVTQLVSPEITVLAESGKWPDPVVIGIGGRIPPRQVIDDDGLSAFEPTTDGIDFYESLEGMLVQINNAVVVGPTSRFGEIAVLADNGANASLRTARGGILARPGDFNPERTIIDDLLVGNPPTVKVGDRFDGSITGVVDYSFGNFKLLNSEPLPAVLNGELTGEISALKGAGDYLTVASFNVENLDFMDSERKFKSVAGTIVDNLGSPDIVAVQEVQDDTGPQDDGVVAADKTVARLIESIVAAGGPRYDYCQVNPHDKKDGGQPGGNIRVAYLFNPERVSFERRAGTASEDNAVITGNTGVGLKYNPGRIAAADSAFINSRKSLAAEFIFNGHKVVLINNHFTSKGGDDRLFGARQPPTFNTEVPRNQQTTAVHGFVADMLAQDSGANIIVLGDMNEHEFRTPMQTLAGNVLKNLVMKVGEDDRYTYIFNGNSQVLDHIFVSSSLARAAEIDIVHVNAEFPGAVRSSDHDPVLARFYLAR